MSDDLAKDRRFGDAAVSLGLITSQQLQEAVSIQQKMSAMGIRESLASVLVKRGYLDPARVAQVHKQMGEQVQAIAGYQVLGKLGAGGMGAVYKARQVSMDRLVALKVLTTQVSRETNFIERFFREAQAAAKLNHRNIIQAYDVGSHQGIYYFAMEYVEGETLKDLIRKNGPFSEKKSLDITAQVADALAYISRHGLIHRDIKPENIMLDARGVVKLCDFGLAKQVQSDLTVTKAGFTFGTPYYMSPEQINGEKDLDIRADLYSLGASLYFMLTGRIMFDSKDLQVVLTKHLTEPAPSPKLIVPTLSDATCQIVAKLLEKERDRRYRTPEALVQDLRAVQGGTGPVHARASNRKNLWIAGGVAAALLLVVGVVLVLALGDKGPSTKERPAAGGSPVAGGPGLKPHDPAKPKPIDENEVRAEGLFQRAEAAFQQGDWEDARKIYQQLEDGYSLTDFYSTHKQEIWSRKSESVRLLGEQATKQRAAAIENEKKIRDRYSKAQAAMTAKDWAGARDEYQRLAAEKLPDDFDDKELRRLADECDREIRAGELWETIEKMDKDMAWDELNRGLAIFEERYKGTVKWDDMAFPLSEMKERVKKEILCRDAINTMIFRFDAGRWEEVVNAIAAINAGFKDTRTLDSWKVELESRYAKAREKALEPLEKKAKDKWKEAEGAYQAKDYPKADALLAELMSDPLSTTRAALEARPKIQEWRAAIARMTKDAREEKADKLFASAKTNTNKLKWDDAQEEIQKLKQEFKDTDFVVKRSGEIAKLMDRIEAELQKTAATMIDDFEGGLNGWAARADGDKGEIKESKECQYGDKAARIAFPSPRSKWSFMEKALPRKPPDKASGLSVWVKAVDRPLKFRIQIRQGTDQEQVVWGKEYTIGTEWTLIRLPFIDMRHVWSPAADKKLTPPKFDLSKIRTIEISQIDPKNTFALLLDHLKWELR